MSIELQVKPLRFKQFAEHECTVVDSDGYLYTHQRTHYGIHWYETNDRKTAVALCADGWRVILLGKDNDIDTAIADALLDHALFPTRRAAVEALEQFATTYEQFAAAYIPLLNEC